MGSNELLEIVAKKTAPGHRGEVQEAVLGMICNESQPMPLSAEEIGEAIRGEGEFLVLKLGYDDVEEELRLKKLEENIGESLSILVTFEDDGEALEPIERFIRYFHERLDPRQNFRFGIKRVEKLGTYPVTLLFGGILPINQLRLTIGTGIAELIAKERDYFEPRFREVRERLSEEIGIPILPVATEVSETIPPNRIRLVDPADGKILCRFDVERADREGLEIYLTKIYYIFVRLWREWEARRRERGHPPAKPEKPDLSTPHLPSDPGPVTAWTIPAMRWRSST